ncbi:phage tail protein [Limosilactobacillus fermentum]|uniref:tape measure protein n=1 Tax=Limosilactobacillus fermentum TaxID=1613 RepID=UPI0021A51E50|nr:tape measure protein [Limosilactobacillus fermentum]MCT3436762.1 phage tail protein [Limosilactobacillus fermentum]
MAKVQNEMATRITIDTVEAANSMQALRQAISANTNSWKAMETSLKSAGDYQGAAAERVKGLTQSIELQKQRISELRERQEGLDQSTQQGAQQFVKLENQISQANKQMASYEAQLTRAKSSSEYYSSGLANLQRQYQLNASASQSYIARLEAEGRTDKAQEERLKSLRSSYKNLQEQQKAQEAELERIAETSGKTSEAYKIQQTRLNETATSVAKAKAEFTQLDSSLNPNRLTRFRQGLGQLTNGFSKSKEAALSWKGVVGANLISNAVTAGISTLTTQMQGVIKNGIEVAKTASAIKARWQNIGVSANGIKQLTATMADVKTNTNLGAEAVNKLQTQLYGLTGSVSKTNTLTKGVASLADQLKLSQAQAEGFAGGLTRIENAGKVTSGTFGRLTKQAPGLASAMAKSAGMSEQKFMELVQSGKMTSDQFNGILAKASKNYDKNAKAFGQTSGGAAKVLQENWKKTQAKLAEPLVKVQATGLNELNKALNNKDTQRGIQQIGSAIATLAVNLAKMLATLAKNQGAVKAFVGVVGGLIIFTKAVGWIKSFVTAIKLTGTALKVLSGALGPAGWIILGITAVIAGLTALYKNNKKFRDFVNGIVSATKNGLKNVGKFFSNTWGSVTKGLSSFWSSTKKSFSNGWNDLSRATKSGSNSVTKWWDQTSTQTSRVVQDMAKQHPRTFRDMYKVIQDRTQTWHDLVSGRWDRLGDDTKKTAQDMHNFHRRVFGDLYNWLNDKTNGRLGDMLKAWKDKLGAIGDVVSGARDAIHKRFVDLVRGIISPFNSMLDGLRKGINWILEKVGASGIGGSWSVPMPSYANGTNDTHPGGLAIVNDGNTGHYREMYRLPNGQIGMFPATRNMIVPLPKGTSVLDGDSSFRLARILGQTPHYADGIGSFFSGLVNKGKDILSDVDKILAHPIQFVEDVFKKFVNVKSSAKFAQDLIEHVPSYVAKQMGNWIKKQFEELADPGGSGVERWRPYVVKALATLHLSSSLVGKVLRQIQTESGGNPKAMGGTDGLADGHAEGLMQVKPGTFAANKLPGHGNIWNGFDNLLAGLNYARKRYGDSLSFLGQGHGYANGGLISNHGVYEIAEKDMPEYVIPTDISKRSRAYQLLGEVITQFSSESKAMGNSLTGSSLVSSESEIKTLNSKFDRLLSLVTELIGVNNDQVQAIQDQGSLDMQRVYRKQARDMRMRQTGLGGA